MKKIFIASGVALVAFATVASAATFTRNLTVGSSGADVTALQTALIAAGQSIPAGATGYFGSQTQAAVKAYQVAKGIVNPGTGFVGPLTLTVLNGGTVASAPAGVCPVGFTCTPVAGAPVNTNPGTITTAGVAGTIAFSIQSTPSNGTSVDKGQTADIARYKLQAGASDMAVSSLQLDFNIRPWLTIGSIVVKDEAGTIIASKSNLTQNDFTEITVGTDYRVSVPVSMIVAKAVTRYITVSVSMLPVTDQCSAGNCTYSITKAQLRAVDGTGVTDTELEPSTRSFLFTGTNNGQIVVTVDSSSPLKKLNQISNSNQTDNVVLGVYDLKSQNKDATLRSFNVRINTGGTAITTLFSDIKIKAGTMTYSADTIATSTTFTNLSIALPKDVYVPITIIGKIAKPTSIGALDGATASTTLFANTTDIHTEDATFNTVAVNAGTFISSDQIFSASSAVVSSLAATLGSPVVKNNTTTGYPVQFDWNMTAGDNTLFIPITGLATFTSSNLASTTLSDYTLNPGSISGDTATYYVVPAGSSRHFTLKGSIDNTNGTSGLKTVQVTGINYTTSAAAIGVSTSTINYNLETLKVTPVF